MGLARPLNLALDGRGAQASLVEEHLARQHHILAAHAEIAQGVADKLLARPRRVAVGRVDKGQAELESTLHNRRRARLIERPLMPTGNALAKAHAAKAQARNANP